MAVLEEYTTTGETHIIYRCRNRACRAPKRVTLPYRRTVTIAQDACGIHRNTVTEFNVDGFRTRYLPSLDCEACGTRYMESKVIKGVKSDKPCDARCMGAVGPACDCSCAGANHGQNWS